MSFHIVIPARFDSKRLPGKVLMPLKGKPMLQWVYERAMQCGAASVTVATDDERVVQSCHTFGYPYLRAAVAPTDIHVIGTGQKNLKG